MLRRLVTYITMAGTVLVIGAAPAAADPIEKVEGVYGYAKCAVVATQQGTGAFWCFYTRP